MKAYKTSFLKAVISFPLMNFLMYVSCFGNIASPPPPPINDECSGAIPMIVDTICNYATYSSVGATASIGVPNPGCANYIGGDVWFSVIVPATGRLIFESQGLGMLDGGMAIYSGGCGSLTLIACDDNSSSYTTFMPMINQAGLISGTTIYIRFWASSSPIGGTFNLCVYNPPIPLNDECSGAIAITADTTFTYTTYTNIGATSSLGVSTPSCANYQGGDVWFSVVVPPMGHLIFSSQDQGIVDGGMAIYSGNCGSLNLISCNDNISLSSLMPKIDIYNLIPGAAIYIRFWKNGTSLGGAFGLNVYYPPPPINDDCSGAITIFADTICTYHTFTTSGATPSSGVSPPTCANNVIADVWIKVVVPTSGNLIFDSQNQGVGTRGMAIYSGSCGSLVLIACDSSDINHMPRINRTGLTPGSTIYIRFWENSSFIGSTFLLCVLNATVPINDDCSGAIAIIPDTICSFTTYSNVGASASIGVPAPGCTGYNGGDVWFSVVVPSSGRLVISSQNQGIGDGSMAIYSGSCNSLNLITCNGNAFPIYDVSNYNMPQIYQNGLIPGSTIYIRFWKNGSILGGAFGLCVYYLPPIPVQPPCTNLGFENGFDGWYGTQGNPIEGLANAPTPIYSPTVFGSTIGTNFELMTGGTDYYGGFSRVFNGSTSLKLGNQNHGETFNAASIEQTFLVTPANTNLTYNYAIVLQNPNHPYSEQPFFQIELFDPNGNLIPCGIYTVALPNSAFTQSTVASSTYYKPWTPICLNLTAYLGQNIKIRFTSTDCVPSAHFGYAYIDCSCSPYEITSPDSICLGQSATISAPIGALSYLWSPGGDTTSSITVSPSATTIYSCYIATQGNTPCYGTLTRTLTVKHSPLLAGSNSPICLGQTLQLTSSSINATSYNWTGPNGFIDSIQNPIITQPTTAASGVYIVKSTIDSGCPGIDTIIVNVSSPVTNILNPIICGEDVFAVGTHYYGATGTYYDTLQNSYGCDSTIITHLTVLPKQQTNLNPVLCQGQTFAVGTHVYSTTGYYTDSLTTASGCDSIVITHLIVNLIPATPGITQNNSVLTSNAPFGNQWYSQNGIMVGDTNQSLTLTSYGDYYVIVNLNGCVSDTSNVLHITNVGVSENESNSTINIYPNPVANELIIEAKENKDKIEFEILNAIGQVVFKGSLMEKTVVQTKNFAQGMYVVRLGNGKRFEFRKVVKSN